MNIDTGRRIDLFGARQRLRIAADPTKTYVPPKAEEVPPFLNFAPLQNSAQ